MSRGVGLKSSRCIHRINLAAVVHIMKTGDLAAIGNAEQKRCDGFAASARRGRIVGEVAAEARWTHGERRAGKS